MILSNAAPIDILLVEDSPGDVALTTEALQEASVANTLHVVGDGEAALAFLRRELGYGDAPRPDLIVLDLNLPKKDGLEVLAEVKGDPRLRALPVVVLSTSAADGDVSTSYDLHANCYITKPVDYRRFRSVVQSIEDFWLATVRLPGGA